MKLKLMFLNFQFSPKIDEPEQISSQQKVFSNSRQSFIGKGFLHASNHSKDKHTNAEANQT